MSIKSIFASIKRLFYRRNNDLFINRIIHKTHWDCKYIDSIIFNCMDNEIIPSNLVFTPNTSEDDKAYAKSMLKLTLEHMLESDPAFKDQVINFNKTEQKKLYLKFQEDYVKQVITLVKSFDFIDSFSVRNYTLDYFFLNNSPYIFQSSNLLKNGFRPIGNYYNEELKMNLMLLNMKEGEIIKLSTALHELSQNARQKNLFPNHINPSYFESHPIVFTREK